MLRVTRGAAVGIGAVDQAVAVIVQAVRTAHLRILGGYTGRKTQGQRIHRIDAAVAVSGIEARKAQVDGSVLDAVSDIERCQRRILA